MPFLPDSFCKTEKVRQGCNKQGDYSITSWINDKCEKTFYFPTRKEANRFRKTHTIINGLVTEVKD